MFRVLDQGVGFSEGILGTQGIVRGLFGEGWEAHQYWRVVNHKDPYPEPKRTSVFLLSKEFEVG